MRTAAAIAGLLVVLAIAACAPLQGLNGPRKPPAYGGLITDPAGTVDTTHGAKGVQTTPR